MIKNASPAAKGQKIKNKLRNSVRLWRRQNSNWRQKSGIVKANKKHIFHMYQCVSLKQWTCFMVLSIDSCVRCGGLTKRFLKHRYDVSLVKHMTIVVLSWQVPSTKDDRE